MEENHLLPSLHANLAKEQAQKKACNIMDGAVRISTVMCSTAAFDWTANMLTASGIIHQRTPACTITVRLVKSEACAFSASSTKE